MTARNFWADLYQPSYFRNILRRTWVHTFLYTLILFLCMPVPILMECNALNRPVYSSWMGVGEDKIDAARAIERLLRDLGDMRWLWVAVAIGLALVFCAVMCGFLTNKKQTLFFHSLPVRRSVHYLAHYGAALLEFSLALVFNALVTLAIFALTGRFYAPVVAQFLASIGFVSVYFLLTSSVTFFAATLTGRFSANLLMVGLVAFLPLGVYAALWQICSQNTYYTNADKFMTPEIIGTLSFSVRPFTQSDVPYTAKSFVLMILAALFLLVFGYFIYRLRKTERVGNPSVFETVGEVLKYIALVPITYFAGYIFGELGNSVGWFIFGGLAGILLGTIFINLFLYRSPKRIFGKLRYAVIFAVAFFVFFFASVAIQPTVDRHVPSAKLVSSMEVEHMGLEATVYDREVIDAAVAYGRYAIAANETYQSAAAHLSYYNPYALRVTYCGWLYAPKRLPFVPGSQAAAFFRRLELTEAFRTELYQTIRTATDTYMYFNTHSNSPKIWNEELLHREDLYGLAEAYLSDLVREEHAATPVLLYCNIEDLCLPIHAGDTATMEYFASLFTEHFGDTYHASDLIADLYDSMRRYATHVEVTQISTGETTEYRSGTPEYEAVLQASASLAGSRVSACSAMSLHEDYYVLFYAEQTRDEDETELKYSYYRDEFGEIYETADAYETTEVYRYTISTTYLIAEKLPDFLR